MGDLFFADVVNPVTHGTNTKRYTDYEVRLKTGTPLLLKCECSLRRRYSDFEALKTELEQVSGCVVPPLPTRGILRQLPLRTDDGLFDQTFIEERRAGLETFLNLVVHQPAARKSKCLQLFFQPGSSMGCGGAYGTRRPADPSTAASNPSSPTYTPDPPSNMIYCDICSVKFTLINRKKLCGECRNYFCSTCLPRESGKRYGDRICFRCKELIKTPPLRTELMKLRVKDLQNYLIRKHVNTKSCVEKKDLVELVLRENGGEAKAKGPPPTSSSWEDPTIRVSDQVPLERKNNFPKSYVESSHRREWFEKLSEDDAREVEETLVEEIGVERKDDEAEETLVEPMEIDEEGEDEVISVAVEDRVEDISGATEVNETEDKSGASGSENAGVSSDTEQGDTDNEVKEEQEQGEMNKEKDEKELSRLEGAANRLNIDVTNDLPSSSPSSPRKFAHHSMVYLSELESLDDLKELSSKQVKEILAMNRVNFKGCVEKEELLKIVERLWKQDQKSKGDVEELDDDSLCKICMDAPVDCVMLECGHMCTCTNCGKQMAECPICRQYVIRVVRTFKS